MERRPFKSSGNKYNIYFNTVLFQSTYETSRVDTYTRTVGNENEMSLVSVGASTPPQLT